MELVTIFVDANAEGLYAIRYNEGEKDEFERLFDDWDDTNFVLSYLMVNEEFLKDDYYADMTIDDLVTKVHAESQEIRIGALSSDGNNILGMFKPLEIGKKQFTALDVLQLGKAVLDDKANYPKPILRIYGVRISEKSFVITGGAIKIVHLMEHHVDTKRELEKMEAVRNWLTENDVNTQDDLNYCYGEEE
jgi:hypothetical protein